LTSTQQQQVPPEILAQSPDDGSHRQWTGSASSPVRAPISTLPAQTPAHRHERMVLLLFPYGT